MPIIPLPDGVERFLGAARDVNNANARPIDDDRDGVPDDDPPEDLNGDGLITQMRVRDPEGAYLPDPDEPRLLRKADRAKGERPVFTLYTEGLDNDGDGEYNEDGLGGTDLNRNFPHAYPELAAGAGENELSEPESLALADFVLNHPNIAAVIVYGRHDNIIHLPGDKQRDVSGRGYRDLHPDDTPIYRHLSERFKELTGLEDGPKRDNAGSFYTWVYNQRGLPVAATTLWWVPKAEKPEKPNASAASQPAATHPATTQPTPAPAGASSRSAGGETPTTGPTSKPENETRKDRPGKAGKPKAKGKGKDPLAVDRRWLRYSDEQRDGAGFVDWQPYEHPTLGRVEIGGFAPGFRENPPPAALAEIVKQQLDWIDQLAAWLPNPRIACCTVERKTESVYAVELSIVNEGYLPTALAMARTARVADPFVFRLDLPAGDVLGGRRVAKVPWLGGMGATRKVRWLVRGQPGQEAIVHVYHKRFGSFDYAFHLKPTATEDK
ncbi:MAG: M14 family zinc carboxypeptidase [Phycisphaerae bacterium]